MPSISKCEFTLRFGFEKLGVQITPYWIYTRDLNFELTIGLEIEPKMEDRCLKLGVCSLFGTTEIWQKKRWHISTTPVFHTLDWNIV